ncbi:MAG: AlbA family DNA-binding domain-containing protein [Rhodospirillales bacterium]
MSDEEYKLQELVDDPHENLHVEYKAWVNLDDNKMRAKIARHFCALANHGGGYLVFGIKDDMTSSGPCPEKLGSYNQDTFSGIIKRYLIPSFQVELHEVSSKNGVQHPVIRVPSHGAEPICGKCNGPDDPSGRTAGIIQGVHYIRANGPESAPVNTPELWGPLIRRCALHDRQNFLEQIESLFRSSGEPIADSKESLQNWHTAAHQKFLVLADADPRADELKRAHYQFSYQVNTRDGQQIDMPLFLEDTNQNHHKKGFKQARQHHKKHPHKKPPTPNTQ